MTGIVVKDDRTVITQQRDILVVTAGIPGPTGDVTPAALQVLGQVTDLSQNVDAKYAQVVGLAGEVSANTTIVGEKTEQAVQAATVSQNSAASALSSKVAAEQAASTANTIKPQIESALAEAVYSQQQAEQAANTSVNSANAAQQAAIVSLDNKNQTVSNLAQTQQLFTQTSQLAAQVENLRATTQQDKNTANLYRQQAEQSAQDSASSAQLSSQHAQASAGSAQSASQDATSVSALFNSFRGILLGSFSSDLEAEQFAQLNGITINDGTMYQLVVGEPNTFRIYNGVSWQDYDSSVQVLQAQAQLSATQALVAKEATLAAQAAAAQSELSAAVSASSAASSSTTASQAAQASQNQASLSAQSAQAAELWAANPEDQEIVEGSGDYSALHWAAKSATSQGIAGTFAGTAVDAASRANQALADAVAVVTGGTASITAAPGRMPIAGASGVLDDSWTNTISGVNAQALHRSPNAVTALFVYDTSKDSDGGAWTKKCQHTSWYNEAINGKWLGAQPSEFYARNEGAELGPELVTNGTFVTSDGWFGSGTGWSISGGAAVATAADGANLSQTRPAGVVNGRTYVVTFDLVQTSGSTALYVLGNTLWTGGQQGGSRRFVLTATGNNFFSISGNTGASAFTGTIDNISIREVVSLTAQSGDYFQLSTDGRFYRLWKNLFGYSSDFSKSPWAIAATSTLSGAAGSQTVTVNSGQTSPLNGVSQQITLSAGVSYVYSVEVGNTGTRYAVLSLDNGAGYRSQAWFDLQTGVVGAASSHPDPVSGFTASISAGSQAGRYVISVSFRFNTSSSAFRVMGSTTQPTGTGGFGYFITADGSTGLPIFAAQLEVGTSRTSIEAKTSADTTRTEVFRGNKRDFPRLAGIVAEAANVTVYDLTEPGRPMWMRFVLVGTTAANVGMVGPTTGLVASVTSINGRLSVAHSGGGAGLFVVDYLNDSRVRIISDVARFNGNIAQRNTGIGQTVSGSGAIANGNINAVAMTVLPDAPVDPVTGLKVPTIAVATAAGVSVIKHNGTVVNSSSTFSYSSVDIKGGTLFVTDPIRFPSFATNIGGLGSSFALTSFISYGLGGGWSMTLQALLAADRGRQYARTSSRVYGVRNFEPTWQRSVGFLVTNTYNTGHQPGDIRRTYLADVGAGSVTGPELVTNGTFDTDTTGWSSNIGSPTVVDGKATGTINSTGFVLSQTIAVQAGKSYRVNFDPLSSGLVVYGYNSASLGVSQSFGDATSARVFVPTTSVFTVAVYSVSSATRTFTIDNISVREVVADRSYKARDASITGTLTKTQVASAAQLVAYFGFSAANYLREPYSADLDFGTGEWSVGAWVNAPVTLPVGNFPAIGPELVSNGGFADATGWTNASTGTGTFTVSSGVANVSGVDASNRGVFRQAVTCVVGKTYKITATVTGGQLNVALGSSISLDGSGGAAVTQGGEVSFFATAPAATMYIKVWTTAAGGASTIDNISVREAAPALIADRARSSGALLNLGVTGTGNLTATAFDGTTTRTVTTTAAYNTGTWLKAEADYTTDGTLSISVNGVEVAATRGNPLLTLNNSNAVLTIGNSFTLDAPFPGSIALLKLSATVPTAEQAQWMYEQEKQMFREGAQVCLPDAGAIADLAYDEATDKWIAVSAANESEWSGLVRTSVTPVPAGSYSRVTAGGGVQMLARTTTNPGVDVTIPAYGLREELVRRAEVAARLNAQLATFDYVGGFTASTTTGNTAITSATGITYPTSYIGAQVTGAGIPSNTTVVSVSGTTIYLSAAATATATNVQISFTDFILPVGYEAKVVLSSGLSRVEGSTKDFTRRFDGFKETIRFAAAPGNQAAVQIQAVRSQS